jgi:ribosome-associated protein
MQNKQMSELAVSALDDLKAVDIRCLHVAPLTDVADYMIIATGTSNRHVSSMVDHLITRCKESGVDVLGVEGQDTNEWVLVDLVDVVVHVMLAATRDFYDLERLWGPAGDIQRPDERI